MADVTNYVPGVGMAQGEGHRDAPVFRGNTSTSDFFVDGMRDDTQYFRDLYNVERIEVLKGPNGMMFGRGGVGGVINRVTREADWSSPTRRLGPDRFLGPSPPEHRPRAAARLAHRGAADRHVRKLRLVSRRRRPGTLRHQSDVRLRARRAHHPQGRLRAVPRRRTTDRGVPSVDGRPLDTDPSTFFGNADVNTARVTVNALSSLLGARHRQPPDACATARATRTTTSSTRTSCRAPSTPAARRSR